MARGNSPFDPLDPGQAHYRPLLNPALRDYIIERVLAAPPGPQRNAALGALGHVDDAWDTGPVDWAELEREADLRGITVADVIYGRATRDDD